MQGSVNNRQAWSWVAFALLAVIGVMVMAVGATEPALHLVFGGAMLLLIAVSGAVQMRAQRPGLDGATPSNTEKAAWAQIGMGLAAIMVLGGVSLGSMRGSWAAYLWFAMYAVIVAFFPLFRRRFIESSRGYREVAEDERDLAIRAQGDYLAKRLLELALVALGLVWVFLPGLIQSVRAPLQVACLLLLPILVANVAGEARVAWLHWRDRQ